MANKIGIRLEDKNAWERRAPLTPDHVHELVERGVDEVGKLNLGDRTQAVKRHADGHGGTPLPAAGMPAGEYAAVRRSFETDSSDIQPLYQ